MYNTDLYCDGKFRQDDMNLFKDLSSHSKSKELQGNKLIFIIYMS